jgi:hypothetical protein
LFLTLTGQAPPAGFAQSLEIEIKIEVGQCRAELGQHLVDFAVDHRHNFSAIIILERQLPAEFGRHGQQSGANDGVRLSHRRQAIGNRDDLAFLALQLQFPQPRSRQAPTPLSFGAGDVIARLLDF